MAVSMESKRFLKTVFILAAPLILQEMVNALVIILDVFMISSLGEEAIAAAGLAGQIFFLYTLLLFGVNSGASVFMGQFWGKGDALNIRKTMGICFLLSFFASTLFAGLSLSIPETLMGVYSKDPRVIDLGVVYLRVLCIGFFFMVFSAPINMALRATGQTKAAMLTTLGAVVSNVILNYFFIFIFGWGIRGAAAGTVISRGIQLFLQIWAMKRLKLPILGRWTDYINPEKAFIKRFMAVTVPVILNEFTWAVGNSAYNIAYRECGTASQSGMQIALTVNNLFGVVQMGVGAACGIVISNTLGAGELDKAADYSKKSIKLSVFVSLIMSLALLSSSGAITGLFNVSPLVLGHTRNIILVLCFSMMFKAVNFTSIVGILRSGGDTAFCLVLDAACVWLVGLPLALLGAYLWALPIHWVYALAFCEEFVKTFFSLIRVRSGRWVKNLVSGL